MSSNIKLYNRADPDMLAIHEQRWRNTTSVALLWHIINWCLLATLLSLSVFYFNTIPVRNRVFSLLDISISQPKEPNTENYYNALIIGILVPFGIYFGYGIGYWYLYSQQNRLFRVTELAQFLWPQWLWFYAHMMGLGVTCLVCEWIKDLVDELPPTFLYTCFPDGIPSDINNPPYLVNTSQCTNPNTSAIFERRDFPAKYATASFSTATMLTLFLYSRHVRMPFQTCNLPNVYTFALHNLRHTP